MTFKQIQLSSLVSLGAIFITIIAIGWGKQKSNEIQEIQKAKNEDIRLLKELEILSTEIDKLAVYVNQLKTEVENLLKENISLKEENEALKQKLQSNEVPR
jgi:flagellar basal body-associated protein FliL